MMDPSHPELQRLLGVIERLRAPGGCPWDREQTEQTMAPHLLEETYEAIEAIQAGDLAGSCEELGDVLMNVLMIAQIAREAERFDLEDVAKGIADKLIRRHPHVFGDVEADDADTVLANWEAIKKTEKATGTEADEPRGALQGVPESLPALLKAFRVGEKAARTGFDWPDARGPRAKLAEELDELDAALAEGAAQAISDELGDVLFAVVNVARHAGVNPEMALRGTVRRFMGRFAHVERELGERMPSASLDEMETLWQQAKSLEPRG